jgi:FAD/FMN-containing dehydrogenase
LLSRRPRRVGADKLSARLFLVFSVLRGKRRNARNRHWRRTAPRSLAGTALDRLPACLPELLALVRRESGELLTTFEFMSARSIAPVTNAMPNPPSAGAGPGGAILVEFACSSRHLDLDGLMEAMLSEAIETRWVEDAYVAQSGSQRRSMWELRETIPEGEKRWPPGGRSGRPHLLLDRFGAVYRWPWPNRNGMACTPSCTYK